MHDLNKGTPVGTAIERATAGGATFEQQGSEWLATARRRGRPMPLVIFKGRSHNEVAVMFCAYFHIKL
jgi:hypothetical protein